MSKQFFKERNIPKHEQHRYRIPESKLSFPVPLKQRLAELWMHSDNPKFAKNDADRREKTAALARQQNRS
jgi:hypothetical protein